MKALGILTVLLGFASAVAAQSTGTINGKVVLDASGDVLHHATVLVVQLGKSVESADDGSFVFKGVPPGKYTLVAHMHALTDERRTVEVTAGGAAEVQFRLRIEPLRQEITVTASGKEETVLEAFSAVTSMESLELSTKQGTSLGEILENQTGVARRSFGPGSSRPVLRGFDGDRVLVLADGMPTGTLSYQSGEHGEPVNAQSLERVEVVRGPSTLLYGTNAIGGVVNMVTGHHQAHQHPHEGLRGYVSGLGGTNNGLGGGSGGVEYGLKNWLLSLDGGGQRAGDYSSPLGIVENSRTVLRNGAAHLARYAERNFFSLGYSIADGDYGVPASDERVKLAYQLQNVRFMGGFRNLNSYLDSFSLNLNSSKWMHQELVETTAENEFFNKQFTWRGVFEQRKRGRVSGSFGFSGLRRDYESRGAEAINPPVTQNGFSGFAVEQFDFEKFRIQAGGRIENNRYSPGGSLKARSFTGFSGSAGISVPLWSGGLFVANYNHSYRAPALEELYSYGPHHGNMSFEIGDPNLKRELSDGFDFSLRHQSPRARAELNYFFYHMHDFVFLAPTDEVEDGLAVANYSQADAQYQGVEGRFQYGFRSWLWLNLGLDAVQARLTEESIFLPRIPPIRGRAGVDYRWRDFSVTPELILANRQTHIYSTESETAGFAVFGLRGSYTKTNKHAIQVFSVNFFNAGNSLYRNHLSFIKEFAPEIGRGVQFSYTLRFF